MTNKLLLSGLAALTLLTGCVSTTTRSDVRDARRDVRDANQYGDRQDQREARRDLRRTKQDYRRDQACRNGDDRAC